MKKKILVIVQEYPQVSETYIKNEVDALAEGYDLELLAMLPGSYPYRSRRPCVVLTQANEQNVLDYFRRFAPAMIHGHYLAMMGVVFKIAHGLNVPFTIRAHSFDVLGPDLARLNLPAIVSSDLFRGVLCFPFMRQRLIDAGFPDHKVFGCNPVIDVHRFRNRGPNGPDVMNVGAALPKKNMEDFILLSKLVPERRFNLYGLGYDTAALKATNTKIGGRVAFVPPVDPEDMPIEYKRHCWLVYTASRKINTVGWPMALIEAQASGVGVYIQRLRDDLKEYIGESGFFFDAPADIADALRVAPSESTRAAGFEWAEQFDYRRHLHILTDLWR